MGTTTLTPAQERAVERDREREAEAILDDAEFFDSFVPLQRLANRKGFEIERAALDVSLAPERLDGGSWDKIDMDTIVYEYVAERRLDPDWTIGDTLDDPEPLSLLDLVSFLLAQPDLADEDASEPAIVQ